MKETVKLGIVLLLFTAISAGVLAVSNEFTAPIIAEFDKQASFGALIEIFGDEADDFDEIEESLLADIQGAYPEIVEVHKALKDEKVVGYALKSVTSGYGGNVYTISGILLEGSLAGMRVVDNSETPNLGTKIEEEPFKSSFDDKSITSALKAVASPSADDEVLALSGATVSTGAVVSGVNKAREAFIEFLSDGSIDVELPEEEDPLEALFPDADEFEEIEESLLADIQAEYPEIVKVEKALSGDEIIGYAIETVTKGYSGDLNVISGILKDAAFSGIRVRPTEETAGLGTQVEEEPFTSTFEGKPVENKLKPVGAPSADDEVGAVSGATVSTEGVLKGVNKARQAYIDFLAE